ncbi:MAG: rRNA maturation RNase YbeY [Propionibacteriaceae bacterium]|jgi:probable rRNA maturation factor|nr:rRNA maturation RNase YbeY [Propionibacteriaceae bacterium]
MIDIMNESGEKVDEEQLAALAAFAMDRMRIHPSADLSILLVDETTMANYHEKFMDEPGPTDVLSFPMDELRPGEEGKERPEGMLGDIVLCPTVTDRQAKESGRTPQGEMNYLLLHGFLHLLGFDHAEEEERAVMFGLTDALIDAWESWSRQKTDQQETRS